MSNQIVVRKWAIPSRWLLTDKFVMKHNVMFETPIFGTDNNAYMFKLVYSGYSKKFKLVVVSCCRPALFGLRLELFGLYNQGLRRTMPDFRMPDNAWLLWEFKNHDAASEELVIVCNVEIKAYRGFQYCPSTPFYSFPPRSRRGSHIQGSTDGTIGRTFAHLNWILSTIIDNYTIIDNLIIESPIFTSVDNRYEFKMLLNTRGNCFNLLIIRSAGAAYYGLSLDIRGMFNQSVRTDGKGQMQDSVWVQWTPQVSNWSSNELRVECHVEVNLTDHYVVMPMTERIGYILAEDRSEQPCTSQAANHWDEPEIVSNVNELDID
uniref:MATH domain-containing protein n=1 Tax=Trichuris muris TaxID=70415 RepID=A0A5S6QA91_TRIMR